MTKPAYFDLINSIADQERVPRDVAQALVNTENPQRDPTLLLMEGWGQGSFGLTMITWLTATKDLGYQGSREGLLDPGTNVRYGLRYLRKMFDQVGQGSWERARAAYVAGPDLSPWPAADLSRFQANLTAVRGSPDFQRPSIWRAEIGGLLMTLLWLGVLIPRLLGYQPKRRKRRARR